MLIYNTRRTIIPVIFFVLVGNALKAQEMKRVRQTIDTLCHTTFFGRGYLKNGDLKAAKYLVREFEKMELLHFDSSYTQSFHFPVNIFAQSPQLKLNRKSSKLGKEFIVNSLSRSGSGSGKSYYLSREIFSQNHKKPLQKFLKRNLTNKIIIFDKNVEQKFSNMPREFFEKMAEAQAHIVLTDKLTASVRQKPYPRYYPPVFEVLKSTHPKKIRRITFSVCAELIRQHHTQNIIGYVKGTQNTDSMLVVCAHYDHLGGIGNQIYFPGANDNASGVSMLLEIAHYYKKNPHKHDIVFMLFAGEEIGLIGSKYYTENPLFPLSKIKFLLNLDLVGTGDEGIAVVNGFIHPIFFRKLTQINQKYKLFPKILLRGRAANSDHYFFSQKGVPAFFIYGMGGIQAYHDIYDRADTLPLTKYKELYSLLIRFMKKL